MPTVLQGAHKPYTDAADAAAAELQAPAVLSSLRRYQHHHTLQHAVSTKQLPQRRRQQLGKDSGRRTRRVGNRRGHRVLKEQREQKGPKARKVRDQREEEGRILRCCWVLRQGQWLWD